MTVRVVLADDQPLVRAALQIPGRRGRRRGRNGRRQDVHPDVVVMDIRMPGMDGIEATHLIATGPSTARVVVLTTFDDADIYGALRAGASGFLVKDMDLDDILSAFPVVAAGAALI